MSRVLAAVRAEPRATLRTAAWSARAIARARGAIRRDATAPLDLPAAPRVPAQSEAAMLALLRLTRQKCFVTAAVRQAWMHAQGDERELVIGVRRKDGAVEAHAWVDGDAPGSFAGFQELSRRRFNEPLGRIAAGGA